MKKGIVVLLVLLAVVVMVSPAIVGRLAEKSMDENLNWAASESGDLKVTSEHFARGWFSSEGQHRVELAEGELLTALRPLTGPLSPDDLPVLIINTRLDHGLIPLTSMSREKGSLVPGLGSAVSTMQVELPDGQVTDVPGTIYSKIGLGGQLHSNYVLEAGTRHADDVSAAWSAVDIDVTTDPASGELVFDGSVGPLSFQTAQESFSLEALTFKGHRVPTDFGVSVGDLDFALDGLATNEGPASAARISKLVVSGSSSLDDERVAATGHASMALDVLPLGALSYEMDIALAGVDARAMGSLQEKLADMGDAAAYTELEPDLQALFAAGFEVNIDRLDVSLPQGTMTSVMKFSFRESDAATFDWSSLLLNTEASVDLSIPVELVDTYAQGNPQAALAIGGGFLTRRGDAYVMEARLKKGLLTVNGAPIPIPLGTM